MSLLSHPAAPGTLPCMPPHGVGSITMATSYLINVERAQVYVRGTRTLLGVCVYTSMCALWVSTGKWKVQCQSEQGGE